VAAEKAAAAKAIADAAGTYRSIYNHLVYFWTI
jgi:hypothetical protein